MPWLEREVQGAGGLQGSRLGRASGVWVNLHFIRRHLWTVAYWVRSHPGCLGAGRTGCRVMEPGGHWRPERLPDGQGEVLRRLRTVHVWI